MTDREIRVTDNIWKDENDSDQWKPPLKQKLKDELKMNNFEEKQQ